MKMEYRIGNPPAAAEFVAVFPDEGPLGQRPDLAPWAGALGSLSGRYKAGFLKELPLKTERGWLLAVGLGPSAAGLRPARWLEAAAAAAQMACALGARRLDLVLPEPAAPGPEAVADRMELAALGVRLALYRPPSWKRSPAPPPSLAHLRLWGGRPGRSPFRLRRAEATAGAVLLARSLVDEPGNSLYPDSFARRAVDLARAKGLKTRLLKETDLARERLNLLAAVGSGSRRPPRMVALTYQGAAKPSAPPTVLVGKGLTFDSGGLSLKPAASLAAMHTDMAGAAAVLAAVLAAADLAAPLNLTAVLPLAENMPGGAAYRVGDVYVSRSGLGVEITNTDAEGRLILADALSWAGTLKPAATIDVATLTGACSVALGSDCAGLFSEDEKLRSGLLAAAEAAGENLWPLPLLNEYEELLESRTADLINAPLGAPGGAITAALFLRRFAPPGPWAHLDIAGPARTAKARPGFPVGASGFAARTLLRYLTASPA